MTPSDAIASLQANGMTESAIGSAVGASQSTINRIANGRDPRWSLGNRLVALAELRIRRNRSS